MISYKTGNNDIDKMINRLIKALTKEYIRKGYGKEYTEKRIIHIMLGDKEYD